MNCSVLADVLHRRLQAVHAEVSVLTGERALFNVNKEYQGSGLQWQAASSSTKSCASASSRRFQEELAAQLLGTRLDARPECWSPGHFPVPTSTAELRKLQRSSALCAGKHSLEMSAVQAPAYSLRGTAFPPGAKNGTPEETLKNNYTYFSLFSVYVPELAVTYCVCPDRRGAADIACLCCAAACWVSAESCPSASELTPGSECAPRASPPGWSVITRLQPYTCCVKQKSRTTHAHTHTQSDTLQAHCECRLMGEWVLSCEVKGQWGPACRWSPN